MAREKFLMIMAKSDQEIKDEILGCAKNLLRFRFQSSSVVSKAHEVKENRRRIARLKTALSMKVHQKQGGKV